MSYSKIHIGENVLKTNESEVTGAFVELGGERYYRIGDYQQMDDFFISIVSNTDHWMFISSNGSLSCGRKDRNNSLFPYYTVDKIHDYRGKTGSKSYFLVNKNDKTFLWEPFSETSEKFYSITRKLFKNTIGNKIVFEEINQDLQLSFSYSWSNSEKFGFVKNSKLSNLSNETISVDILDGIINVLPSGVDYHFQNEYSNLSDAYKKNERIEGVSLAVFFLSSIPVDRAEPSESLKATTVWSSGLGSNVQLLISEKQVHKFIKGKGVSDEMDVRAARGAYLINSSIELEDGGCKSWRLIAEVNQDSQQVANLAQWLRTTNQVEKVIDEDIDSGTESLKKMVSATDGFQKSQEEICSARHFTNALFNIMRGGIYANNYEIEVADFKKYVAIINKNVVKEFDSFFSQLPSKINNRDLIAKVEALDNDDLLRIAYEYLPLTFSRRHGDPSRPWNLFSIETKNPDGSIRYNYQGNWRDIFQNWEALSLAFPEFIEGIITKFVNASTADGYNPYRIMREGIDWEIPDPDDPWAYIGYWGDHQIIYLQKLLEISNSFHPGMIDQMLEKQIFTYANVPYKIKSYPEILKNPKDTVEFDFEKNKAISKQLQIEGADARLLKNRYGEGVYKVNFMEKILVTLLSKVSNFIPEAGIWLNTQRPEWNDANNALVGNGTSMVTLYYLRRFLVFWDEKLNDSKNERVTVSEEIAELFNETKAFLEGNLYLVEGGFSDEDRKKFADFLGHAHGDFRAKVYKKGFAGSTISLKVEELKSFMKICIRYFDQSIKANKRSDGLYHAYNLISIEGEKISIRHLYEMLEGQVAVLSAGILSPEEGLKVLDALKQSEMYQEDQFSYMLYPNRSLKRFIEKNLINHETVSGNSQLKSFTGTSGNNILIRDVNGNYHFRNDLRNANVLKDALEAEGSNWSEREITSILKLYENTFDHQSFTGRSGTFYGYEGLGSIYWHMVSKLQLAAQECYFEAINKGSDQQVIDELRQHYYEIKAGIGLYKKPSLYGAFPTDAYSHTPGGAGVKQPGLTGQVKEDFISRQYELGVQVMNGKLSFRVDLLNPDEFLKHKDSFDFYDVQGKPETIKIQRGELAFTFCQVPVIYALSEHTELEVVFKDGHLKKFENLELNPEISSSVFQRDGSINQIKVMINKRRFES